MSFLRAEPGLIQLSTPAPGTGRCQWAGGELSRTSLLYPCFASGLSALHAIHPAHAVPTALPSPIPMPKSCISVQSELESAPFVHVPNPSGETPFLLLLTADLPPFLTYEKGDFTWSGLMRFMFIVTSACGICT